MAWAPSSSDLVKLFADIAPRGPNIQHKMIFGYPGAFVNRYLFTALFRQSMIFRLSVNDQAAFLDQPGTAPFEPVPGRKMSGFVLMRDPFAAGEEEISNWMQCALQFASALPPKKMKARKKAL
jgi:hypothetical protein